MKYKGKEIIGAGLKGFSRKTFSWKIINVCNQRCSYCYEGYGSKDTIPNSTFFKDNSQQNHYLNILTILKLKTIGTFEVDLIGGEPTLHPHLFNIIQDLTSNKNCYEISLITNLSKPLSYFKRLDDLKSEKLIICPSLHFDYYSDELIQKCIDINNFEYIDIVPIVMIHDDIKHHSNIMKTLKTFKENNVEFSISFLSSVHKYVVDYNADAIKDIEQFASDSSSKFTFNVEGLGNVKLNSHDVHENKLTKFKGWDCRPQRYIIEHNGGIVNACTGKKMPFFGQCEKVTCPKSDCNCSVQWYYEKSKV